MWVFNSERLEAFLDQLSAGFARGPLEVALFFAALALFLGLPLTLSLAAGRRRRARARAEAVERFETALARAGLAAEETEALREMARALSPDPARWPGVLSRPAAFNAAASRGAVGGAMLARLRLRLGLREAGPQGSLHSTAELEPGAPLFVLQGASALPARVTTVDETGFEVRLGRRLHADRVTVRVPRPAGLFDAEVAVLAAEGGTARLSHAEIATRVQKRKFVRRRVHGTASVRLPDGKSLPVRLVDLSGGGARLEAPAGAVQAGDEISLSLGKAGGWHATLAARAVRVHDDGFSVAFVDVPDAERDKLIRRLR